MMHQCDDVYTMIRWCHRNTDSPDFVRTLRYQRSMFGVQYVSFWALIEASCPGTLLKYSASFTPYSVSNKLPHTAVKPDILYPVVIVRSDVLYVLQLSGVKQAAGWSVILVSIWNTKIRESLRLSWSSHTHISTVRSYTQLLLEPHNSNIITVTSLEIQYVTFSYIVPSHNSSLLRCFTL